MEVKALYPILNWVGYYVYVIDSDYKSVDDLFKKLSGRINKANKNAIEFVQTEEVQKKVIKLAYFAFQIFLIVAYSYRYNRFVSRYSTYLPEWAIVLTIQKICLQSKTFLYRAHNLRRGAVHSYNIYSRFKTEPRFVKKMGFIAGAAFGWLNTIRIFYAFSGPIATGITINYIFWYQVNLWTHEIPGMIKYIGNFLKKTDRLIF